LSTPAATAQESNVQLKEVVVTATKTEKKQQDVTQSVTVITGEEIRKSGATNAAEIVRTATGSTVNEYGPLGALSVITLRGSTYQQVLVLLDGQRLNSASAGGYDLSGLPVPLEAIERIEIVRGSSSALYGSDAVGGVVNIITKKPATSQTTLTGALGRFGYTSASLYNSGRDGNTYYALSASKERSHGHRENSDADRVTAGIKVGYDLGVDSSIEASSDYMTKDQGVPGHALFPSPVARQQTREVISGLRYRGRMSQSVDYSLRAYQNQQKIGFQNPDPFFPEFSRHRSTATGAEAQVNWLMGSFNLVTIGVEGREDRLVSTTAGDHSASLSAAFIQDEMNLGDSIILVVGGRNDKHSVYGDEWSPRASARYLSAGSGTILRASYGKSFRAPTLNDLYWPDSLFLAGNPNLQPESAEEYEGGIEQPFGTGNTIKGTLFRRKVKDLIQWQPDANFKFSPTNIGRARISGVEAEAKFALSQTFTWMVNYLHMFPVDEETGNRLFSANSHIPDMQIGTTILAALDQKTVISLDGRWVKNYVDFTQAGAEKWEYYTVDGKITEVLSVQKGLKTEIFIGMKNMFNRKYEVVQGYPMPPQELYGGLTAQF
jgi:outer membrane cobalamin receptor